MLPSASLPVPREWRELLEELGPVFARRSTHRLFMLLACGLILADRGTVTGMAAAAGIGRQWRRACWLSVAVEKGSSANSVVPVTLGAGSCACGAGRRLRGRTSAV